MERSAREGGRQLSPGRSRRCAHPTDLLRSVPACHGIVISSGFELWFFQTSGRDGTGEAASGKMLRGDAHGGGTGELR